MLTETKWAFKKRGTGSIPWGYEVDEEDPDLLRPIPEHLDIMEKAMGYVDVGCSLRDVADWVAASTDTSCSYQTVNRAYKRWVKGGGIVP